MVLMQRQRDFRLSQRPQELTVSQEENVQIQDNGLGFAEEQQSA